MNRMSKLALAGAAILTVAGGLAYAQQAQPQVPPPPFAQQQEGASPSATGPGAGGCGQGMMGQGMQMGMMQDQMDDDGAFGMGNGRGHHMGHGMGHGMGQGMGHRMGRGDGMRGGPGAMLDANNDGVIGDDEAAAMADLRFGRMDQNGDGNLTEAEFTTRMGGGWRKWFSQDESDVLAKMRKDVFTAMDTDKSGSVSKAEFFTHMKTRLASADVDKDGKVTPWEFRAMPRM